MSHIYHEIIRQVKIIFWVTLLWANYDDLLKSDVDLSDVVDLSEEYADLIEYIYVVKMDGTNKTWEHVLG